MDMQDLVAILVCITALASFLNYKFIKLPNSIGLTVLTLALSIIVMGLLGIGQAWVFPIKQALTGFNFSSTVMNGMISFLLFASALNINSVDLKAHQKIVASLATLSVVISCILIGFSIWWIAPLVGIKLPLLYCLLFGALIAPTDPISVVSALKKTKTPKPIRMKIMGESLFNDAAGIVLFVIIIQIINSASHQFNISYMFLMLAQQALGGLILGYIFGKITGYFLAEINNDETAILMTLALATGGYTIASLVHVSGPICMVIAGLIVGNACRVGRKISQSTVYRLYSFWGLIDRLLNSFLFVMIGLQVFTIHKDWHPLIIGVLGFVAILLARVISISGPLLILEPLKNFNWKVLSVLTWGGMRGGLSIALALSIPEHDHKDIIVGITYAVVVLSIIIQGLTIQPVIKKLFPAK